MESILSKSLSLRNGRFATLDYATAAGIAAAFGLVMLAIAFSGGLLLFFDLNSLLIVLGGTVGATLINFPLEDFRKTIVILRTAFYPDISSAQHRLRRIVQLARNAKSQGRLALEEDGFRESDPFLRKGIELLVDDLPADDLRDILQTELRYLEDRHRRGAQLFQAMGAIAPAMGLIGTLIGLVQMLQDMSDLSSLGAGMATALLTTFYGAVLAYIIFLPLAGKLRTRSQEELLIKELTIEGLTCIMRGVNPRHIEQHLLSFLPPERRYSEYQ